MADGDFFSSLEKKMSHETNGKFARAHQILLPKLMTTFIFIVATDETKKTSLT